jgi:predicted ATP-dependent protease
MFTHQKSINKTAGTLAINTKSPLVTDAHVKEAIDEHCKSIQQQLLEHYLELNRDFMEISPKGIAKGKIYGLSIQSYTTSSDKVGSILPVLGQLTNLDSTSKRKGFFNVTGVKEKDSNWVQSSIKKVRSVILKKYDVDVAQDYFTHIDFSQAYNVDGPSAGVTMSILLCSLIEGKPIKQDVAVTGEINISSTDEIIVTPIGGVHEKIKAAELWGFKKVVIPYKNFKYSIDPSEYSIEVVGARTLNDYLKHLLV